MIAPTASMNPTVVTTGPEFGLDLGRSISAVGEHIIAGVAPVQQPIQLLAVVHGCIGHRIMSDQLVPGVRVHMVLVAEEADVRPACSSAFSSRLFRCLGTDTIVASMIWPPRAM